MFVLFELDWDTEYNVDAGKDPKISLYTATNFLKLRSNKEVYFTFYDYFVPAIVQHQIWRDRI